MVSLLDSRDVLAILQTGFGKSLISQVFVGAKSIIDSQNGEDIPPKILVICPLVGLIKDQKQEAQSMGISCVSLQNLQLKEKVTERMIFASADEVTEERFRAALNENHKMSR